MPEVSVKFEARSGDANDGKIVVRFFEDASTTTFTGKVSIISPTGVVLRSYATGSVSFVGPGTASILVPIPLDGAGEYLRGTYTIQVFLDDNGAGPHPLIEVTHPYYFCPHNSPDHTTSDLIKLGVVLDCAAETLLATDETDYTDITRLTRVLTTTPPAVTNVAASTTGTGSLTSAVTYTNVTYGTELEVSFSYNSETSGGVPFISYGSAVVFVETKVDCDPNLCATVNCLTERFNTLKSRSKQAGGWYNLPAQERENYEYVASLVALAQMARGCNNYTQSKAYIDEAKTLLNCDCGCAAEPTPKPL